MKHDRTKKEISFLIKNGFIHIFSSQLLNKIIQFGTSIFLVRVLSKELFGSWSYALNILSFFLLIQGFGVVTGILQFSSANRDKNESLSYFKYGLNVGIKVNILISICILVFTTFFDLPVKGSINILRLLFLIPLFTIIFESIQMYLRASLNNKKFSVLSTLNTSLFFVFSLIGGLLFQVEGIVAGRYLTYTISILIGIVFIKKELYSIRNIDYPNNEKRKEFMTFSVVSVLNNAISSIVYLIDTFLVGLIIQNELIVASYKTATLIPFNLNFIPLSIMVFAYPYFAQMASEKEKLKQTFYKIQKYLIILNGIISVVLIIFAPFIVKLVFGSDYVDSVTTFRILSFGYFIAGTFRIPAGNVLASIKKLKINMINTIVTGIVNIALDIILIKYMGSIGAAIATVIVFIISSIISNGYLYFYFKKENYLDKKIK